MFPLQYFFKKKEEEKEKLFPKMKSKLSVRRSKKTTAAAGQEKQTHKSLVWDPRGRGREGGGEALARPATAPWLCAESRQAYRAHPHLCPSPSCRFPPTRNGPGGERGPEAGSEGPGTGCQPASMLTLGVTHLLSAFSE